MRAAHGWTERTPEGEKREIRVERRDGVWRFQSKLTADEKWTYHEYPPRTDLEAFHELLLRKYRRSRVSHDDVRLAERMLAELL